MAGLFGTTAQSSTLASNTVGDLSKDVALDNPPEDTITDLAFNPTPTDPKDFLAVSSWDKKVRIYEILPTGQGQGRHLYEHDGPIFSVDFFKVRCVRQQTQSCSPRLRPHGNSCTTL